MAPMHRPGDGCHVATLGAHVVTAKTVLLRDLVTVHDRRTGSEVPVGCYGAEDLSLAAEVKAHDLERNLGLVGVGKYFEGRS